jgi:hypothetical protein
MTPGKADQIIKKGEPVTVHNSRFNETMTVVFIRRDRWSIYSLAWDGEGYSAPITDRNPGGVFDRGDLEIVEPESGSAALAQGV